uniref:Uncharacterized protein n=1 Tax=Romanomermis culicivorax TaxID=13658 RepID=A0A915KDL0_ROMCU
MQSIMSVAKRARFWLLSNLDFFNLDLKKFEKIKWPFSDSVSSTYYDHHLPRLEEDIGIFLYY